MSTHAYIAVRVGNEVREIFLASDGYPSHVKQILLNHYNSAEKAESLVQLGDMSRLSKSNECPNGHSFENKIDGYCVYYGRDRGEGMTEFSAYTAEGFIVEGCLDHQYYYNNGWLYRDTEQGEWVPLVDVK